MKGAEAVRDMALAEAAAWAILRGSGPVATFQTARVFVGEANNVKAARRVGEWDDLLLRPWTQALVDGRLTVGDLPGRDVPVLRDAFDQVFVQLRPPIMLDGDGEWSPHAASHLVERMVGGLARLRDHVGERPVVAVGDLAGHRGGDASSIEFLGELIDGTIDLGVDGWFQSSPIDGWHWEAGDRLTPGVIAADRQPKPVATLLDQDRDR